MAVSAIDTLQAFLEEEATFASETDAQILVLEPIGPQPGLSPILLDQPKQLIGWDVECAIQLPDAGVHSRHAVILRGQRQVVIKAWDPRTWLNGLPVTESPLADGDLLRFGPMEFRVRPATTDELLGDMPAIAPLADNDDHSKSVRSLVLRRSRLSSIRVRLKELRAELAREFERVGAERIEVETRRAELEAGWAQFQAERDTAAATQLDAAVAAAPDATAPESEPEWCNTAAQHQNNDADRMNRLFRQPVRPAAEDAPAPEISAATSPPPVPEQAPVEEHKAADEHTEIADSVADYMEHLLGRMRSRQSDGALAEAPSARRSARGHASSENAASSATDSALSAESPDHVRTPVPRRLHNAKEIRAGVGTLREIANQSARAAVAKHSSRKFRKSVAVTLPLAVISFVLAGVLFLTEGSEARFYSQAFGIAMLGIIALIELANSFWKSKSRDPARTPAVSDEGPDEPESAGTGGETR